MNWILVGIIGLVIVAGGAYFVSLPTNDAMMEADTMDEAMMRDESMSDESMNDVMQAGEMMEVAMGDAMMEKGSYEAYAPEKIAKAGSGKVVLFFRAGWCPTCKALDSNIRANLESIPAGVTILDVDYDTSTALKQKYGVTYQHTLVQVAATGEQITKWSGGLALSDLVSKIQ